jgi:hypothetical protein
MPQNPETRKTACHTMTDAEVLEFHIKQFEELDTEVKKGKRHAQDSPDAGKL